MTAMVDDIQCFIYSAGHLSGSYEPLPENTYIAAPVPFRACPPLTTVPMFNPGTYGMSYDPSQPIMNVHPDDMIGSNTGEPPELAIVPQLTPHHIPSNVHRGRFKSASFSAPATPKSTYLPQGAIHARPLMWRSSNIPLSHAVLNSDIGHEMYMMVDPQSGHVLVNGNEEYIHDTSMHYDQAAQEKLATKPLLQSHPQAFVRPDTFSPAPSVISHDYSPSPSLPITPPPTGTFPQQPYFSHHQPYAPQFLPPGVAPTTSIPLSSPSISEDGCCNPRSIFVNPPASLAETYASPYTSPTSIAASPERYDPPTVDATSIDDHGSMDVEVSDAEHPMEDIALSAVTESTVEEPRTPIPLSATKLPFTPKRPSKRVVSTPPRRRRSSANLRKNAKVVSPIEEQAPPVPIVPPAAPDGTITLPVRGRVPKRVKDALASFQSETEIAEVKTVVEAPKAEPIVESPPQSPPLYTSPPPVVPPSFEEESTGEDSPVLSPKSTIRSTSMRAKRRRTRTVSSPTILPSDPAKVFICEVLGCEKRFRRSEHLKRHTRSLHTLDKPYVCNVPGCNKKFSRSDNLNQHIRVHKRNSMTESVSSAELEPAPVKPEELQMEPEKLPSPVARTTLKRRRNGSKITPSTPKRRARVPIQEVDFEQAMNSEPVNAEDELSA
jgi:Zinc finger, C2H2 type